MPITFIPARSEAQIAVIARLAREIWHEYYEPIIGLAQVEYMVGKFQSAAAIGEQVRIGYEYFLMQADGLVQDNSGPTGYLAVQEQLAQDSLFISKLYVHRNTRGSGTGRAAMAFIEQLAQQRGLGRLWLTVNKGNPAIKAYERMGFQIAESIVMDIGNGFVMDDFRMEKLLRTA